MHHCPDAALPTALSPTGGGGKIQFGASTFRGAAPLDRGAHGPVMQAREPVGQCEGCGCPNSAENGPLWPENDPSRRCGAAHLLGDIAGLEGRCG